MAAFNKFNAFVEKLAEKAFNLETDTLKVVLTNTAPTAANVNVADITQLAAGGGYTTGGATATVTASAQTSGTYKLTVADVVFTASGSMGPFRYAVIYDFTATNGELIGWLDYGSSITLNAGETFTVDFDGTNGVLQIV